jgi:U3 small nucleolar RNA-associated protein 22
LLDGSPLDFTKLRADVRLIPVLSSKSPIPLSRLSPQNTNLRFAHNTGTSSAPTPLYNNDLLIAGSSKLHLLSTYRAKSTVPAFGDALSLLRVWANQRGYNGTDGNGLTIHGFEDRGSWWAALLELVVFGEEDDPGHSKRSQRRKPLGKGLSSYQLFKAALDVLGKSTCLHSIQLYSNCSG